jgi:hypothetical protein
MIHKTDTMFEKITGATCDCCGDKIKVNYNGDLPDHLIIGGYMDGMNLEAVVCTKCVNDKFGFVNIQKRRSRIGYC